MTQSQIRCFLSVAQEKSISKASSVLYISHPAVSKQISKLEEELGVSLFIRTNTGVELTDAGEAFEKFFNESTIKLNDLKKTFQRSTEILNGEYYLGCMEGWDLSSFYQNLDSYLSEKYPNIRVQLTGFNIDQIIRALRSGMADGIIANMPLFAGFTDIEICPLTIVEGIVMFSSEDPIAQKKDLCFSDFADSVFYISSLPGMKTLTTELVLACSEAGFVPKIEYVRSLSAVFQRIQSNHGVFYTSEWIREKWNPVFKCLPTGHKKQMCLAMLKSRTDPVGTAIKKTICQFFLKNNET